MSPATPITIQPTMNGILDICIDLLLPNNSAKNPDRIEPTGFDIAPRLAENQHAINIITIVSIHKCIMHTSIFLVTSSFLNDDSNGKTKVVHDLDFVRRSNKINLALHLIRPSNDDLHANHTDIKSLTYPRSLFCINRYVFGCHQLRDQYRGVSLADPDGYRYGVSADSGDRLKTLRIIIGIVCNYLQY